jgi:ATP-binding protein involved in chromosome partitioning
MCRSSAWSRTCRRSSARSCGTRHDIFGHGGAQAEAAKIGAPFLGEVPLAMAIRKRLGQRASPISMTEPDGPHAKAYLDIARKVWDSLSSGAMDRVAPKIIFDQ